MPDNDAIGLRHEREGKRAGRPQALDDEMFRAVGVRRCPERRFRQDADGVDIGGALGSNNHSTVTDFARLRGWSTSVPMKTAVW